MTLALGIDTGGTYTDAAVVDYDTGRVMTTAKVLTTKHDLALGISQAIETVDVDPQAIGLVSLSTTLATNAIVEGQGAPVCAILIGYEGRIARGTDLATALSTPYVYMVAGGHDSSGLQLMPLDTAAVERAVLACREHVAAFAVSGYFGARNPEHEIAARAIIRSLTSKPVTCGHELSTRLDAMRRATTAALNASLIPMVCSLLDAVAAALAERGIAAPVMVVKGDGSLISAELARERPVETILSGPAASVVGAMALGGASNTVVVDMGGTTTDIAIVRDGTPMLSAEGATVGNWRTMVEAIDVYTCGLGGDSQVTRGDRGQVQVGPTRVVPISVLAHAHPEIIDELREQVRRDRQPADGEFVVWQRGPWPRRPQAPAFEQELQDALKQGPISVARLHEMMIHPSLYERYIEWLFHEGWIVRAGLTPTDCAHVLGWYRHWDVTAAGLAAELLARRMGMERDELCQRVLDRTVQLSAYHAVRAVLANEGISPNGTGPDEGILARALGHANGSLLSVALRLDHPVTAIGAPVSTYWPRAATLLSAPLLVPDHADVANAVGAVAGSVVVRLRAQVTPSDDSSCYLAFVPGDRREFGTSEEAVAYAMSRCSDLANASALAAGAASVRLTTQRHDHSAPVGANAEEDSLLYTEITVTAAGRPAITKGL